MLLVKTILKESKIAGTGLFANEFIKAGTVVWKFQKNFDVILTAEQILQLPKIAKEWVMNFCYLNQKEGGYIVCMDNAKYTNHSSEPNIIAKGKKTIAVRDVKIGQEITENYFSFDELAHVKLKFAKYTPNKK